MQQLEQNRFFDYLEKVKFALDKLAAGLCIMIVAVMTVLITYQVVSRYIFNSPSAVSEVLSRYLFIWLILLAGAYVFGLREHMAIAYVKLKCRAKVQIILDMISELATAIFALSIMIIGGYSAALRQMWQLDSALQIPMGAIYAGIPISGAMIVFYFLYNELKLARALHHLK
ncbi:TRAP transporter small permease [Pasteurellaceae bacterium TAE3-ERU1]|nr:TRAP transporter small permease [Pasteurellaceae bacterium TAE3-ERU1]